ncbi:hypothetical protein D8M23_09700 [Rothia sp. HSID18067]|nr:hypothetical protein D8M23_09700 [Rothia sp. HSID18067]
MTDIHGNLLW